MNERFIIKVSSPPRVGWEMAFKKMHDLDDDRLLMPDVFKDEALEE